MTAVLWRLFALFDGHKFLSAWCDKPEISWAVDLGWTGGVENKLAYYSTPSVTPIKFNRIGPEQGPYSQHLIFFVNLRIVPISFVTLQ